MDTNRPCRPHQQPPSMPAAQEGQRGGGRAQNLKIMGLRCIAGQSARNALDVAFVRSGDDDRGEATERRPVTGLPLIGFRRHKGIARTLDQRGHDGVVRMVRLQQDAARPVFAARATRHLVQQLVGTLCGPQVPAVQTQIRVDHADQGQHRKVVTFRHQLRADQNIDLVGLDTADDFRRRSRTPNRVARHQLDPRFREQRVDLFGQAFDTWPTGHHSILRTAFWAGIGLGSGVAAMVTR